MRKIIIVFYLCFLSLLLSHHGVYVYAQDQKENVSNEQPLTLHEFIALATKNDQVFEQVLIDQLLLRYQKDLNLPAGDLIMSLKAQYNLFLDQSRDMPEVGVSLGKLFPEIGTAVSVAYDVAPAFLKDDIASSFNLTVSQPLAENAFGKSYRLQEKALDAGIDVAEYQIVEAYEDYLAIVIVAYYDWFEAFESLKVGESSYKQNLKLLENIKERQKSSIALPIDVNKTHLLVLAKEERYLGLQEQYSRAYNFIKQSIRFDGDHDLVPQDPGFYNKEELLFEHDYDLFKKESRTYRMLDQLVQKSVLDVDISADDLLPSINLLLGYEVRGQEFGIREENNLLFGGISFDWPFPDTLEQAEYETSKIALDKSRLFKSNTHYRLYTEINNLFLQFERDQALGVIAETKVALSRDVLEAETENYSYGKISLNDYITAVNVLDNNRYNQIFYQSQQRKIMIEWLRILDKLVTQPPVYTP